MVYLYPLTVSPVQIYWYALYGRAGTGSNIKVRLNDHHLRGCGVPVSPLEE